MKTLGEHGLFELGRLRNRARRMFGMNRISRETYDKIESLLDQVQEALEEAAEEENDGKD